MPGILDDAKGDDDRQQTQKSFDPGELIVEPVYERILDDDLKDHRDQQDEDPGKGGLKESFDLVHTVIIIAFFALK